MWVEVRTWLCESARGSSSTHLIELLIETCRDTRQAPLAIVEDTATLIECEHRLYVQGSDACRVGTNVRVSMRACVYAVLASGKQVSGEEHRGY